MIEDTKYLLPDPKDTKYRRIIFALAAVVVLLIITALFLFFKGRTDNPEYKDFKEQLEAYREQDKRDEEAFKRQLDSAVYYMSQYRRTDSVIIVQQKELIKIQQRNEANINRVRNLPTSEHMRLFTIWLSEIDTTGKR